jgi:hypothetical protein
VNLGGLGIKRCGVDTVAGSIQRRLCHWCWETDANSGGPEPNTPKWPRHATFSLHGDAPSNQRDLAIVTCMHNRPSRPLLLLRSFNLGLSFLSQLKIERLLRGEWRWRKCVRLCSICNVWRLRLPVNWVRIRHGGWVRIVRYGKIWMRQVEVGVKMFWVTVSNAIVRQKDKSYAYCWQHAASPLPGSVATATDLSKHSEHCCESASSPQTEIRISI